MEPMSIPSVFGNANRMWASAVAGSPLPKLTSASPVNDWAVSSDWTEKSNARWAEPAASVFSAAAIKIAAGSVAPAPSPAPGALAQPASETASTSPATRFLIHPSSYVGPRFLNAQARFDPLRRLGLR